MEGSYSLVEIVLMLLSGAFLIACPYLCIKLDDCLESLYRNKHLINLLSSKHSIRREQYFNHAGFNHIKYYLSFYPDPFPDSSTLFIDEYYPTSRKHTYEEEKSWEESNGPQTYKGGLKEFVVEEGIKKIGARAFGYNLNLYSIKFPSTLEKIGSEVFVGCKKLTHIELPESIRCIGAEAFTYSLDELTILAKKPPKISDLGIGHDCKIFIPAESENLYKSSRRWRKYSEQIYLLNQI